MRALILTLLLITTGCVTTNISSPMAIYENNLPSPDIHIEFEPYVREFIAKSQGTVEEYDLRNTHIGFANLKGSTVGTCINLPVVDDNMNVYWAKEIEIDINHWENSTPLEKEQLIFHELGHCMLFRLHTHTKSENKWEDKIERFLVKLGIIKRKGYLEDGCPASYMHPYTLPESCIVKHYNYYIDELFDYKEAEEDL